MKKYSLHTFVLFFVAISLFMMGCGRQRTSENTNVSIISEKDYSKGLNLVALGELIKKSADAKTLEQELNKPNSINNLDLDEDGKVDYIKVTEYGKDNIRGLSLTDDLKNGETQEIATIEISKDTQNANMNIAGNNTIYRDPGYASYHSSFGLMDMIILGYLFSPRHSYWSSPYHYGYYPSYYQPYSVVAHTVYTNRVSPFTKSSSFKQSPVTTNMQSPNAGKNSASVQKNISEAHKSFEARKAGKQVGSGGFGNKSSSSGNYSPSRSSQPSRSYSSPSPSRSTRSFGRRR